jgi:hypothetical protein
MGLSSQKKTEKKHEEKTEDVTQTPIVEDWIKNPLQFLMDDIQAYGDKDPYSMIAGASPLQQQAFAAAAGLGNSWQGGAQAALEMAKAAGLAGPNLASAIGYDPAKGSAVGYKAPTIAKTNLGPAAQAGYTGYTAPQLGAAKGYTATNSKIAQIGDIERAIGQSGASQMGQYFNPYLRDVVNTSLADFDHNAGTVRAAQAAGAAKNNAFSGSRYGIQAAATEGELSRARGALDAGLRANAFNTAAQFGMQDADRFANISQFNTGQANAAKSAQAGLAQSAYLRDANSADDASKFLAGLQGTYDITNAGFSENAAKYAADAFNRNQEYNTGQANDFAKTQFQGNLQTNLAQAGLDENQQQFYANALNGFEQDWLQRQDAASQYSATAFNGNQQFNAGQMDGNLARMLQAAGLMGDLGNVAAGNQRQDLAMMADLGNIQRGIQADYLGAPLTQLGNAVNLTNSLPLNMFTGQQRNGNYVTDSTTVTKESPSMFNQLLGAAALASKFTPLGSAVSGLFGGGPTLGALTGGRGAIGM